jgi:hypothetical protein
VSQRLYVVVSLDVPESLPAPASAPSTARPPRHLRPTAEARTTRRSRAPDRRDPPRGRSLQLPDSRRGSRLGKEKGPSVIGTTGCDRTSSGASWTGWVNLSDDLAALFEERQFAYLDPARLLEERAAWVIARRREEARDWRRRRWLRYRALILRARRLMPAPNWPPPRRPKPPLGQVERGSGDLHRRRKEAKET